MARRPQTYKSRKDTRIKKKMVVGGEGIGERQKQEKGEKSGGDKGRKAERRTEKRLRRGSN